MALSNTKAKTAKTSVRSRSKKTKSSSARASNATASRKKLRGGFRLGDLVTGRDRSYRRSIYKVIGRGVDAKHLLLEFVSLKDDTIDRWLDSKAPVDMYQSMRKHSEFRKANRKEIKESRLVIALYRLHRLLRKLGIEE